MQKTPSTNHYSMLNQISGYKFFTKLDISIQYYMPLRLMTTVKHFVSLSHHLANPNIKDTPWASNVLLALHKIEDMLHDVEILVSTMMILVYFP